MNERHHSIVVGFFYAVSITRRKRNGNTHTKASKRLPASSWSFPLFFSSLHGKFTRVRESISWHYLCAMMCLQNEVISANLIDSCVLPAFTTCWPLTYMWNCTVNNNLHGQEKCFFSAFFPSLLQCSCIAIETSRLFIITHVPRE